ncbi:MAG TPA: acyl-CoA dehydrogenase family protein [Hypericibacter adhaerens]|jgi:alkylation response protein AidB-like acyl-CoA dehydrogenase|uniref:Acyl-CoA dehydrogenase n=1 Tax=Hypericibacter adhaerens TaxID=2602016 RepID=A0A5J6MUD9_9PROT|nr:acyl-CoA dehydrogenase family protein [Hypericibacter adhaerens]QEX21272.1 acyl-CoA dehydrogenase [Hypericibacter adhaerens]HWA44426.1 acyl-CoA dehydrogenase family protein [Hypericibacter adhaerens]
MRIDLTEEQGLLRDSVQRFVAERYPFDRRQKLVASTEGYSEEDWRNFADLGWLGLPLPESAGGLGMGPAEVGLVMEAFGRGLVTSPYLATVLLGAGVIAAAGSAAQKAEILPLVAEGRLKLTLAYAEDDRQDPAAIAAKAEPEGGGFVLSGVKTAVPYAAAADRILVAARTGGRAGDASGLSFFLLDRNQRGLALRDYAAHDGSRIATLHLDRVSLGPDRLVGAKDGALPVLEAVLDQARAALCAEASGVATAVYEKTLAYFKTREQFGKLIGSFQALQHRLADVYMKSELLQSAALDAAEAAALGDSRARAAGVSAAKSLVGTLGREIGKEGVQLHGGIGMTWDYEAGHYLKRLTFIDLAYGDSHWHLERYRRLTM